MAKIALAASFASAAAWLHPLHSLPPPAAGDFLDLLSVAPHVPLLRYFLPFSALVAATASAFHLERAKTAEETARVEALGRAILGGSLTTAAVAEEPMLGAPYADKLRHWFASKQALIAEAADLANASPPGADLAARLQQLASDQPAAAPPD